jgi:L-lactate permease
MQRSGAERIIDEWLKEASPNPVAQLMIVGWAFPFMIEGSSGFGTPAATSPRCWSALASERCAWRFSRWL